MLHMCYGQETRGAALQFAASLSRDKVPFSFFALPFHGKLLELQPQPEALLAVAL